MPSIKDEHAHVTTLFYINLTAYTSESTIILRRCNGRTRGHLLELQRRDSKAMFPLLPFLCSHQMQILCKTSPKVLFSSKSLNDINLLTCTIQQIFSFVKKIILIF